MPFEFNYKEDGDVYYGSDVLENNAFSMVPALSMLVDGATSTNQYNNFTTLFTAAADIDTTNSTCLVDHIGTGTNVNGFIYFCTVYDKHDDSSIDAGLWTTNTILAGNGAASVTENTVSLNLATSAPGGTGTGTAEAWTNGSGSDMDLKAFSGNSEVVFNIKAVGTKNGDGDNWGKIMITNGTTDVTLYQFATTLTATVYHRYRLIIDKSGQTADLYQDGVLVGNGIDISSATTNWYLMFTCISIGPTQDATFTLSVYNEGYLDGSAGSSILFTAAQTAGATSSVGIAVAQVLVGTIDSTDSSCDFSADSGSNFAAGELREWAETADTGTGIQWKLTVTHPTSISATEKNIPTITGFSGFWS